MTKRPTITAIVYDKKGRVLSVARNSYQKTHPLQAKAAAYAGQPNRIFLHAEIAAILKCDDWSKAHKLAVFRYDNKGNPACAKPCKCCEFVIAQTGIKKVEHT